ncbi:DUF2809 domain-containing protein [Rothia kristinae]|uniref:DUF2809 domain-containing protein n=1 Tax=Rothia kristinae TaxID=37923 RepID=A0A1S2N084_9MICC|nr:DUF2809 domain-containing protein [Rothia kristinae]OIJ35824.1 hypothetical protein BK826_05515 [Rothia kristinae]
MSCPDTFCAPRAGTHASLLLLFLAAGAASFVLRSRVASGGAEVLDASGTLCWAGALTIVVSLALRCSRWWRPWTWVIALALSLGVEFLQATPYPAAWQAAFPPTHLVFGSTFSWGDVPWYVVGVGLAWWLLGRRRAPAR